MRQSRGKGSRQTPKKCVKATAFPCKNTCLPRKQPSGKDTNCRNPLKGQAKTAVVWVADQQKRLDQINKNRSQRGVSLARLDKAGYIVTDKMARTGKEGKAIAASSQPKTYKEFKDQFIASKLSEFKQTANNEYDKALATIRGIKTNRSQTRVARSLKELESAIINAKDTLNSMTSLDDVTKAEKAIGKVLTANYIPLLSRQSQYRQTLSDIDNRFGTERLPDWQREYEDWADQSWQKGDRVIATKPPTPDPIAPLEELAKLRVDGTETSINTKKQDISPSLAKLIEREIKEITSNQGKVYEIDHTSGERYYIELSPSYGWKNRGQDLVLRDASWNVLKSFPDAKTKTKKAMIEWGQRTLEKLHPPQKTP